MMLSKSPFGKTAVPQRTWHPPSDYLAGWNPTGR